MDRGAAASACLAALATALGLACAPPPPSVVLVTLDTLRRDHVGAYGDDRGPTPHLDALAASGRVHERAFTTMPTTGPAHASMFTGLMPRSSSGPKGPSAPKALLGLGLLSQGYYAGLGHFSDVDLHWTATSPVTQVFFLSHSCFDDDGVFFHPAAVDLTAARARGLADLRHGPDAAMQDSCGIADAVVATAEAADVTLEISGDVARPDGSLFATQPASLPIPPP